MLGSSSFVRALRTEAPNLTRRFFGCQCRPQTKSLRTARDAFRRNASTKTPSQKLRLGPANKIAAAARRAFTSTAASRAEAVAAGSHSTRFFPNQSSDTVGYWLLGSAASVFGIVIFGGLTRLTESGLSITEWKPVTGSLPPMSEADWEAEFIKYKSSPEFAMLNSKMTLAEFKSIYWMEWIHRLWGRVIGITFVLPAIYFTARRQMSAATTAKVWGIAGLIGFQGFLGWWMVKSGLKDDLFAPGSTPRVSQYRLTAHLGAAFVVYLSMFWNGLTILRDNRLFNTRHQSTQWESTKSAIKYFNNPALKPFRRVTLLLIALTFTTAMSGALVAGLDAGLIYNEFPWMGQGLTPPKSELLDPFYSHKPADAEGKHSDLLWRNMFENPSLVQLDHRLMATTTFTAVLALFAWSRFSPVLRRHLNRPAQRAVHGVLGFASLQVVLGLSTLLYLVPTPLASAHQAGALALLTWTFVLFSRVHASGPTMARLQRWEQSGKFGRPQRMVRLDLERNNTHLARRVGARKKIEERGGGERDSAVAKAQKRESVAKSPAATTASPPVVE